MYLLKGPTVDIVSFESGMCSQTWLLPNLKYFENGGLRKTQRVDCAVQVKILTLDVSF